MSSEKRTATTYSIILENGDGGSIGVTITSFDDFIHSGDTLKIGDVTLQFDTAIEKIMADDIQVYPPKQPSKAKKEKPKVPSVTVNIGLSREVRLANGRKYVETTNLQKVLLYGADFETKGSALHDIVKAYVRQHHAKDGWELAGYAAANPLHSNHK